MLSWVGCRVASPNPDAVHIELAMTPPQSYPFIKQADHLSKHEKHFWSRVSTDGLTDQQIEAYLKDGYEWDYDVKASFYLYFRSKESPGWSLAKPYSLSYELNGTYLIPDKLESCQSSGYYGESQTVLFPTKDTAVQLLILIVPKDASLPRKQFICDCSREQFGKIEKNKGFRILFLNYAFFYPLLTVPLPPWDSLINVSNENWINGECDDHEKAMIQLLREACVHALSEQAIGSRGNL